MNGVRNTHFHQNSGQTHAYRNISSLVAFLYSFRVDTSFKVLKHTPLQHLPAILIINVIYTFPNLFNHLYITLGNRPRPLMCCIILGHISKNLYRFLFQIYNPPALSLLPPTPKLRGLNSEAGHPYAFRFV